MVHGQAGLWEQDTTKIKYKNPPPEPGTTKPELGMARFFLWFDPPWVPSWAPYLCPPGGVPSWHPWYPTPLPWQAGHHWGMGQAFFLGGWKQRDATAKGMGKALRVSCPLAGVRVAQTGRV